ncbi:hypothetical protein [Streptomyces sp. 6N223]|uniref:hypothetical protein n=1 Tax=Streptomyces sp. 6N223 TaxID=3457412 RepID=UPI003FD333AF
MEMAALVVLAVTTLIFVTIVIRVTRAVGRAVDRTRRQVRHTVTEVTLAARAVQPGAVGEVARLRRSLRTSLTSAHDALLVGSEQDPALREALSLLGQLRVHAGRLDSELAMLTVGEPDRGLVASRLPELRERARRITRSADSLRTAAQDRAHHDGEAVALDTLHQQIEIEASALRHWAPAAEAAAEPAPSPGLDKGPSQRLRRGLRVPRAPRSEPRSGPRSGPRAENAEG